MPEGDSVHLLAARLRPSLVDRVVVDGELRSGGRAGESLSGRRIVEVDTHGKHLLTRFDDATTLHTHLRMQGSWTLTRPGRVLPSRLQRQVRVRARLDDGHTLWGVDLPVVDLVPTRDEHAELLALYKSLTMLRRDVPEIADPRLDRVEVDFDEEQQWMVIHRGRLRVAVNLADREQTVPLDAPAVDVLLSTEPGFVFGPDLPLGAGTGPGITLAAQSGAVVGLVPFHPGTTG